jgi:pimeloyl-ACP methyl ester carboxylesterase
VAADGNAIGYDATGDGPVLLLVHGAAADRRQWRRLVPVLARSFTVVAMDRRSRGLSGPLGASRPS